LIFIVTGKTHSGKTTFVEKAILKLKKKRYRFYGILSRAVFRDRKRIGYDALDLKTGKKFPLLRRKAMEDKKFEKIGRYYILPEGIRKIYRILLKNISPENILVIDEIGPLEIKKKKGLWQIVQKVLRNEKRNSIIVVRNTVLDKFLNTIEQEKEIFSVQKKGAFNKMIKTIKERIPDA